MNKFRETGWANNIAHSNKQNYCKQVNISRKKRTSTKKYRGKIDECQKHLKFFFVTSFQSKLIVAYLICEIKKKKTNINKKRIWIFLLYIYQKSGKMLEQPRHHLTWTHTIGNVTDNGFYTGWLIIWSMSMCEPRINLINQSLFIRFDCGHNLENL